MSDSVLKVYAIGFFFGALCTWAICSAFKINFGNAMVAPRTGETKT